MWIDSEHDQISWGTPSKYHYTFVVFNKKIILVIILIRLMIPTMCFNFLFMLSVMTLLVIQISLKGVGQCAKML